MIERDYIDDGFGGGDEDVVDRLMGEVLLESGDDTEPVIEYRGTVPQIMEQGGFRIKHMIRDGETRPGVLRNFPGMALGLPWDTATDQIRMQPLLTCLASRPRVGPDQTLLQGRLGSCTAPS